MDYKIADAYTPFVDLDGISERRELFRAVRYHILEGGRGGGKSHFIAETLVLEGYLKPHRILCARQIQKSIKDSVLRLLADKIEKLGLSEFYDVQRTAIYGKNGTEFIFEGIQSNVDSIKSMEGITRCWLEEAHSATEEALDILIPSIRGQDSMIIISMNPGNILDASYQRFVANPPDSSIHRKINFDQNPWFPAVLELERSEMERRDPDAYRHIWLGEPTSGAELAVIHPRWIRAALDAHKKLDIPLDGGASRVGYDIASSGGDRCVAVKAKGSVATGMLWWKAGPDELLKSCQKAYSFAREDCATIVWDSIGVGASAGERIDEINNQRSSEQGYVRVPHEGFNAGSRELFNPDAEYMRGVTNKDHFSNLKSQVWWMVADRFRNTYDAITNGTKYRPEELISIDSGIQDVETLMAELSLPQRDIDMNGRVKVESKKDLDKRGVNSPDMADAFIMAFVPVKGINPATQMMTRRRRQCLTVDKRAPTVTVSTQGD